MPVVEWAHYCERAYLDTKNRPCLLGLINSVTIPKFPALLKGGTLAVGLVGSPGETVDLRVRFARHGDSDHLLELASGFAIGPAPRTAVFIENTGMPADDKGSYEFRVGLQGEAPIIVPLAIYPSSWT
jgi:hypothetical protein